MIKEFSISDLDSFVPNAYSGAEMHGIDIARNGWEKITIYDTETKIIACFNERKPGVYAVYCLVSAHATLKNCAELKRLFKSTIKAKKPRLLWTISQNFPVITNWHLFLGMKKRRQVQIDGNNLFFWTASYGS